MTLKKKQTFFFLHLIEFKKYLFITVLTFIILFFILFNYGNELIHYLITRLLGSQEYTITPHIYSEIVLKLNITLIISIYLIIPCIILNMWLFLSTGFYKFENFIFIKIMIIILLIFIINMLISHNYILPIINNYLITDNKINLQIITNFHEPDLTTYTYFSWLIITYSSLFLTYPFFFYILLLYNKISLYKFIYYRKFVYLFFLICVGIISPPDILLQLVISIPVLISYELLVFIFLIIYCYKNNINV
jgi:sec-independent protein translocase protein TatC